MGIPNTNESLFKISKQVSNIGIPAKEIKRAANVKGFEIKVRNNLIIYTKTN